MQRTNSSEVSRIVCLVLLFILIIIIACNPSDGKENISNSKDTIITTPSIPTTRRTVNKEPVASYSEKTDNPLNDWYFKVQLFETEKTFHYLIKLQFEEIRGEDTLKLPNFGRVPEPQIKKGDEKYSCIIGFLDKENKFREYKKVYVKDNHLKITAIRHYAVKTVPGKSD